MILVWLLEANYTLNTYLDFSLLVANYSRNIPFFEFFLYWQPGCRHITYVHQIFQIISYTILLIICVKRLATSHWQPLFSKKIAVAASFSYKIGGGLIFLRNWRRRQRFGNITGGCSDMVWIRGASDVGFPIFADADADADFEF